MARRLLAAGGDREESRRDDEEREGEAKGAGTHGGFPFEEAGRSRHERRAGRETGDWRSGYPLSIRGAGERRPDFPLEAGAAGIIGVLMLTERGDSAAPRRAAALVLVRGTDGGPDGIETFLVRRARALRFLGGYTAFPGGTVEAEDAAVLLEPGAVADGPRRELIGCAARELLEETGILLAGADAAGGSALEEIAELRRRLVAGGGPGVLWAFLEARGLHVEASRLAPLARFITPRFSSLRYDTTFFLLETAAEPRVLPGELESGAWRRPRDVLASWRAGAERVAAPVLAILEELARQPVAEAARALGAIPPEFEGSGRAVRCAPGFDLIPLATPPLPPWIPTNAFLVGGTPFALVDPGPTGEAERRHLFAAVDARLAAGDRLAAIVLTHHHPDHVGALEPAVERYRVPVCAHATAGKLLGRRLDRELADGEELALGGLTLRALFTPGHAEGHLALHDPASRSLIAGDLISTIQSMYVGSPGGNLRLYFESLVRVRGLELDTLYPSHGPPDHDPARSIDETLRHRRKRIEEIAARLAVEPREPRAIAAEVYAGAPDAVLPLTVRAVRAALEYLTEEGRAVRVGKDEFRRAG
jgi:glyoxylase-like metal-dependent hydrolase (beta-lactamase superfamily II)/8-oxo-dGTP pyrophosphatase MutT (NUDIX family)